MVARTIAEQLLEQATEGWKPLLPGSKVFTHTGNVRELSPENHQERRTAVLGMFADLDATVGSASFVQHTNNAALSAGLTR
jgi:hypothetical protein